MTATPTTPDLRIDNLTCDADSGRRLLAVPHLHLAPGQAVVLRGPSGAGKSTLLAAMAGLIPVGGRVEWGGHDIAALPDAGRAAFRRDHIGLVFQDPLLFEELTALDNAALPALYAARAARAAIRARAADGLARLGIADPHRPTASFSGGERQRIAMARALACDPPILLADEPTASLDRDHADRLTADLLVLARDRGRMLVVVSHDPALHRAADRLIDLADGRIVGDSHG
ncbi:ABC transporter ATP-binding protein [Paracoccus sp. p3-h83]|uniref:ABC transporter ATP-binding protein n=1 Tax=Paracoccus sp. p3-h83 TaxID=3342805 RepID=UPI0035B8C8F5